MLGERPNHVLIRAVAANSPFDRLRLVATTIPIWFGSRLNVYDRPGKMPTLCISLIPLTLKMSTLKNSILVFVGISIEKVPTGARLTATFQLDGLPASKRVIGNGPPAEITPFDATTTERLMLGLCGMRIPF